ncbi:MAG TPA: hypothetical protein VER77_01335 [Candidatus Dormibacteraeota bacterium]|nr:hypothetical protein [Candidatus Dormibacteraeota bacterium]
MGHLFAQSGNCARAKRALVLAAILASLDAAPTSRCALAATGPDLYAMLPEFNRICTDLTRAREELRLGTLDEDAFGDRILALFVDADSLMNCLQTAGASTRRIASPLFAMSHGIRYLIESLRENYVGIVARNGTSFVAADRALQAAVAWRSGVGGTGEAAGVDAISGLDAISGAARP